MELVTGAAQYQLVRANFGKLLRQLLPATALTAAGIVTFAWAANPPTPPPVSVSLAYTDLRGADLEDATLDNADLRGADLTGADLAGASMSGALLAGITWSNTVCPDGKNSDDVGATCLGHLNP